MRHALSVLLVLVATHSDASSGLASGDLTGETATGQILVGTILSGVAYLALTATTHRTGIANWNHDLAVLGSSAASTWLAGEIVYRMGKDHSLVRRRRAIIGAMSANVVAVYGIASEQCGQDADDCGVVADLFGFGTALIAPTVATISYYTDRRSVVRRPQLKTLIMPHQHLPQIAVRGLKLPSIWSGATPDHW